MADNLVAHSDFNAFYTFFFMSYCYKPITIHHLKFLKAFGCSQDYFFPEISFLIVYHVIL